MQPSLALPEPPRTIGDILRRVQARAAPAPTPQAPPPEPPALPIPTARPRTGGVRWHRHELEGGAYELRANGSRIVRVAPTVSGWRVDNIGAATRTGLTEAEADELAARIARMVTAG